MRYLRRHGLFELEHDVDHPGSDQHPQGDVCPRHADAPISALCAVLGQLFRPMNEASRRSRPRHFGLPRHSSSRSDPACFSYAPSGARVVVDGQVRATLRLSLAFDAGPEVLLELLLPLRAGGVCLDLCAVRRDDLRGELLYERRCRPGSPAHEAPGLLELFDRSILDGI
jgi:hypothetical protein